MLQEGRENREESTGGGRLCEGDGTLPRTLTSKNYYRCLCEWFFLWKSKERLTYLYQGGRKPMQVGGGHENMSPRDVPRSPRRRGISTGRDLVRGWFQLNVLSLRSQRL